MRLILSSKVYGHVTVAKIAEERANMVFDELCVDNDFYAQWKGHKAEFIQKAAPLLVEEARQILSAMLGDPELDDSYKEKIYDALMHDRGFPRPKGVWAAN